MKSNSSKQFAGVWLDSQHALILALDPDNGSEDYTIKDKVASTSYHGGKGEHTSNNADHANNLKYFKSIAHLLLPYDEILVFGPGKSQEQLINYLNEDAHFENKKITIDSTKHLTDAQLIAKVRDFFEPVL